MRACDAPASVAVVGIGKELEGSAAGDALEVVFDDVCRPLWVEEVHKGTRGLLDDEVPIIHSK